MLQKTYSPATSVTRSWVNVIKFDDVDEEMTFTEILAINEDYDSYHRY